MPSGEVDHRLAETIRRLNARFSTPRFEPHVTLLGGLAGPREEIIAKTSALSALLRGYEIRLTTLDYLDEYFRCLFIRVEETETVMDANRKAGEIFGRRQDPPYMPHLSLLYGNLPLATKQGIVAGLGREPQPAFLVTSIHLFSTEGAPESWYRLREFPFPTGPG